MVKFVQNMNAERMHLTLFNRDLMVSFENTILYLWSYIFCDFPRLIEAFYHVYNFSTLFVFAFESIESLVYKFS